MSPYISPAQANHKLFSSVLFQIMVVRLESIIRDGMHSASVRKLIREVTLNPGDLVYIPRGVGHGAVTNDKPSVHITVGLEFYQWIDIFKKAIEELEKDAEFRKSMPPYFLKRKSLSEDETEHLKLLMSRCKYP